MQCGHVGRVRMLYKTILRLHRGLPEEFQVLGTNYVKDEFRRNKFCSPTEAAVFMTEWANYAITLATQLGLKGPKTASTFGESLAPEKLDNMSDDQIQQLYDLMLASQGIDPEAPKTDTPR